MTINPLSDSTFVSRRAAISGACRLAALAALSGCESYGGSSDAGSETPKQSAAPTQAGGPLARTVDVPVGGGLILTEKQIVITQPEKGTFKGFTTTCTHTGCQVAGVSNGTINCPCHGSKFSVADGAVKNGPATRPLPAKPVKVDGEQIVPA